MNPGTTELSPAELTVAAEEASQTEAAARLAARLGLALAEPEGCWQLRLSRRGLELIQPDTGAPLRVDFSLGRLRYRRRHGGGRDEPIARAVGLGARAPAVVDATAGFGRDAFILASLGCRVLMLERSPVVAALLADGLRRAAADPELGLWLPNRLRLIQTEACRWLRRPDIPAPEVVYLDPMYPPRRKSALVKKESRALQRLAGPGADAPLLLAAALATASRRVVVKRPAAAAALNGPPPSFNRREGATRYDVYDLPAQMNKR